MTRLEKTSGVRDLYRDIVSKLYFLRSQKGGGNSFLPLNTTRKKVAITNIEELKGTQFRQRHDMSRTP